jgi:hypothetical protein
VLGKDEPPAGRASPASDHQQARRSGSAQWQNQTPSADADAFLKRRLISLSMNFLGMLLLLLLLVVLVFLLPPLRCPLGLAILLGALIASMNYAKLRSSLRQRPGGLRRLLF